MDHNEINLEVNLIPANSRFVRPVVVNLKNEWRRAYLEASKAGAVVCEIRTRTVAVPWDGRMH
ncbi:hypothetical protein D3C87_475740 [compost metagenome]